MSQHTPDPDYLECFTDEANDGSHLRNLLAIIHRDGGHHTEAVGIAQSCRDAATKWYRLDNDAENMAIAKAVPRLMDETMAAVYREERDALRAELQKEQLRNAPLRQLVAAQESIIAIHSKIVSSTTGQGAAKIAEELSAARTEAANWNALATEAIEKNEQLQARVAELEQLVKGNAAPPTVQPKQLQAFDDLFEGLLPEEDL